MNTQSFNNLKVGDSIIVDGIHKGVIVERICCPIPTDGFFFWYHRSDGEGHGKYDRVLNLWPADAYRVELATSSN